MTTGRFNETTRFDEATCTLYVGSFVAMQDGIPTPEYVAYLQFQRAYVDSEIAKWGKENDLWEWAIRNPEKCSSPISEIVAYHKKSTAVLDNLRCWRTSLVEDIAWMATSLNTPAVLS